MFSTSPATLHGLLEEIGAMATSSDLAIHPKRLERRRRLGQDRKDEVWEGVYHVVPAADIRHAKLAQRLAVILDAPSRAAGLDPALEFNLGDSSEDFRVPDGGLLHPDAAGVWVPTAALVIEILSPGDETWRKLLFYAAHAVEELPILDPEQRTIHWLGLTGARRGARQGDSATERSGTSAGEPDGAPHYGPIERSRLIDLGPAELSQRIDWP